MTSLQDPSYAFHNLEKELEKEREKNRILEEENKKLKRKPRSPSPIRPIKRTRHFDQDKYLAHVWDELVMKKRPGDIVPDEEVADILEDIISEDNEENKKEIIEKRKLALTEDEVDEVIERGTQSENLLDSKYETILLKEPNNLDLFLSCLNADRLKRLSPIAISPTLVSCNYWFNHIDSVNTLLESVEDVMRR
jgi:hypothetical protein